MCANCACEQLAHLSETLALLCPTEAFSFLTQERPVFCHNRPCNSASPVCVCAPYPNFDSTQKEQTLAWQRRPRKQQTVKAQHGVLALFQHNLKKLSAQSERSEKTTTATTIQDHHQH